MLVCEILLKYYQFAVLQENLEPFNELQLEVVVAMASVGPQWHLQHQMTGLVGNPPSGNMFNQWRIALQ